MTSDDEIVQIELDKIRRKQFQNSYFKNKISVVNSLNLRIVNIKLETGEIETLITNLPQETMSKEQLKEIYDARWGIECAYKTLKQRLQIQNYTAQTEIGIQQDIYATFLLYNIFCYSRIYLNLIINKNMRKKGKKDYYDVNQSHLISRLKIDLFETILDSSKVKNFINNLIKKNAYPHQTKLKSPINMKKRKQHPTDKYKHKTTNILKKKLTYPQKRRKIFSYQKLNLTTLHTKILGSRKVRRQP